MEEKDCCNQNRISHHDAEIAMRAYELRRETVMRESRNKISAEFWPKSIADVKTVIENMAHPLNAPYRQVASYWEMIYSFAKHGAVNLNLLMESNGEGMFLFAKIQPFLAELRKESPQVFVNAEWVANHSERAKYLLDMFRKRIEKMNNQ
jgi:ADP-glucose pyrophosphorylase